MPRSNAYRTVSAPSAPRRLLPKEMSDTRMPVRPSVAWRCTDAPDGGAGWADARTGRMLIPRAASAPCCRTSRRFTWSPPVVTDNRLTTDTAVTDGTGRLPSCPARDIIGSHARDGASMANALTTARVLLALPFAFLMMQSDERRAGLAALVVAAAFAQYVVDSYWMHRGRALRASALGRWNGILYFVPLGGDVLVRAGLEDLRPAVSMLAWILVVTTMLSMVQRLWAVTRRSRTAPGSPDAERGDPPPR